MHLNSPVTEGNFFYEAVGDDLFLEVELKIVVIFYFLRLISKNSLISIICGSLRGELSISLFLKARQSFDRN